MASAGASSFTTHMKVVLHATHGPGNFGRKTRPPMLRNATLLLASCIAAVTLDAQVTLTYGDLSPTGVQTNIYLLASGGPTAPPSDGTDQTWDLSAATWQPVGTMHFRPAAGTPYAATYPQANWAWEINLGGLGTTYTYLQIDNSGMYVVADGVPMDTEVYTDTKKVLQFPMSYGTAFSDVYVSGGGPVNVNWSYSGHGTLLSSLGTYPDLAKVGSDEDDILFWNKTPLYPLVLASSDGVRAFVDAAVGVSEVNGGRTTLAYPNPCTTQLMVDGMDAAPWRITDINGRLVQAGSFPLTGVQTIDVAALDAGSYLFLSDATAGTQVLRFSKQ